MAKHEKLKNLIDSLVKRLDEVGKEIKLDNLGQAAQIEIASFMIFISAADGIIKWEEASVISELCDLNLTPQSIGSFIEKQNIFSEEFPQKVPLCLQVMVDIDNHLWDQNPTNETPDIPGVIIEVFKLAAAAVAMSDENIHDIETIAFDGYIGRMLKYIAENSKRRK